MMPSRLITAHDLANTLGVRECELHYLAYNYRLPFICNGERKWCIAARDLAAWKHAVGRDCVGCN